MNREHNEQTFVTHIRSVGRRSLLSESCPRATAAGPAATSPGSTSSSTRRTRAFHHYTIGGDLEIEEEEVLDEKIERVTCRWCGATGDRSRGSAARAAARSAVVSGAGRRSRCRRSSATSRAQLAVRERHRDRRTDQRGPHVAVAVRVGVALVVLPIAVGRARPCRARDSGRRRTRLVLDHRHAARGVGDEHGAQTVVQPGVVDHLLARAS